MERADPLLLALYGDDFTGSTDAMEFLTRAGARTVLFIAPPTPADLARYPGLRAIGVAGMTRSMPPQAMEKELRPAFALLKTLKAPHVHYKVCSTFDSSPAIGSIGRAIDVGADVFRARFVPLLVGAPALGRHCLFGNLFARAGSDGEIHRLDRHPSMSHHPVTPSDEADLRRHLAKQTSKRIGLFDILHVGLTETQARLVLEQMLADHPDVILFDILYENQLRAIGSLIDAYTVPGQPLFSVGSSGVEMALGAHWAAQGTIRPVTNWFAPEPAQPLLVLSGSCSPVTERQIAHALSMGFAEVALDTPSLVPSPGTPGEGQGGGSVAMSETLSHLKAGRSVILHTSRGSSDARIEATANAFSDRGIDRAKVRTLTAELFGSALGRIARRVLEHVHLGRLVVAGGDTSSFAARALGIEALEMIAPIAPGAPLCRAYAPGSPADGMEVNFKGGQVGAADYFEIAARGKPKEK